MSLRFAHRISPTAHQCLPAVLLHRRRPRNELARRDWLRIAHRLAAGMSPRAAALPEGGDEGIVAGLLRRAEFAALVAAAEQRLAEPPESNRRRLVALARQALERALLHDWDASAACFVLEEDAHGRDAAVSLAESVLQGQARALQPLPPVEPPGLPSLALSERYDPLRTFMQRGVARLRGEILAEDAIRRVAEVAAEPPEKPQITAARAALALRRRKPRPALVPLRHGLFLDPATGELVGPEPPAREGGPRQAQAP